jgi:hypothetical protein
MTKLVTILSLIFLVAVVIIGLKIAYPFIRQYTGSADGIGQTYLNQSKSRLGYLKGDFYNDVRSGIENYSDDEKSSFLILLLTATLSFLLFLTERLSLVLVLDWFLGYRAVNLWRARNQNTFFTIFDGERHRPISGVEIAVLDAGRIKSTFHSDSSGRVFFSWPNDGPATIRASKMGYKSVTTTFANEVYDMTLEPLVHDLTLRTGFYIHQSVRTAFFITLIVGTFLLIPTMFHQPNELEFVTLVGYLCIWLAHLRARSHPYHLAQVINYRTEEPLPGVHIILSHNSEVKQTQTDQAGLVKLAYPLPEKISLRKPGYHAIARQRIPITAISSDILLLIMRETEG